MSTIPDTRSKMITEYKQKESEISTFVSTNFKISEYFKEFEKRIKPIRQQFLKDINSTY